MTSTKITDAQFHHAQDAIDALTRKTRRGTVGTPEELAAYREVVTAWETANALPRVRKVDRATRDAELLAIALNYRLVR